MRGATGWSYRHGAGAPSDVLPQPMQEHGTTGNPHEKIPPPTRTCPRTEKPSMLCHIHALLKGSSNDFQARNRDVHSSESRWQGTACKPARHDKNQEEKKPPALLASTAYWHAWCNTQAVLWSWCSMNVSCSTRMLHAQGLSWQDPEHPHSCIPAGAVPHRSLPPGTPLGYGGTGVAQTCRASRHTVFLTLYPEETEDGCPGTPLRPNLPLGPLC